MSFTQPMAVLLTWGTASLSQAPTSYEMMWLSKLPYQTVGAAQRVGSKGLRLPFYLLGFLEQVGLLSNRLHFCRATGFSESR